MAGNPLRRLAPAIALVFLTTLLAGVPGAGATADPNANPALQQSCGLDIVLVLDRSSSIATAGAASTLKSAANAFLAGLKNTGSKVALVSFGTSASVDTTPGTPSPITDATLPGLEGIVNGLSIVTSPTAYTNWDDGLVKAKSQLSSFGTGSKPLVVVITDGSPNRWINDATGVVTSGLASTAVSQAVAQAQLIKAAGSRIFALGVGTLNTTNLQAISGTVEYAGTTAFVDADWAKITSYSTLQTTLTKIATDLCKESVVVHKLIGGAPAPGWQFTATQGTSPAQVQSTDTGGIANFGWTSVAAVTASIVETGQTGYTLQSVLCTKLDAQGAPVTVSTTGVNLSVGPLDKIDCTFNNVRSTGSLTINKTANATGTFLFDVDCSDGSAHDRLGGNPVTIVGSGHETISGIPTGTTCDVTERPNSLFSSSVSPALGHVTIDADGESVNFTNTRKTATLTVTKDVQGGTGTFHFNVNCDGESFDSTSHTITNDGQFSIEGIPTGTSCTVTEVADPLFISSVSPAGGTVSITDNGGNVAFTNVRKTGTLTVTKDVQGGTDTFTFDVNCDGERFDSNHAITPVDGHGQFTVEGIPTGTSCAVTEDDNPLFNSSVLPADGTVTIDSEGAVVAFVNTARPDGITIDKKVNGADHSTIGDALLAHVGDTLTYTVVVTNNGQVPLTIATLSDSLASGFAAACPHLDSVLAPAASFTCTYTMTAAGDAKNVASVKGVDDLDRSVTASDSTYVDVIHPAVTIVKTANPIAATVGDTVTFSYLVTNTGDTVLSNLTVKDDVLGLVGNVASLAPGASTTLTKTMVATLTSPLKNVGTIKGTDPLHLEVSASDDATITVAAPITVSPAVVAPVDVLGVTIAAPPVAAPAAELPRTGSDILRLLLLGGAALLAGLGALLLAAQARRRSANLN